MGWRPSAWPCCGRTPRGRGRSSFWRSFVIGFGAWNIADTVLFHWLLEWHHIRLDTEAPLLWDLGWVVAFGIAPLAAALIRRGGRGPMGASTLAVMIVVIVASGAWAARPPKDAIDASGTLAAVRLPKAGAAWRLYRSGALLVSTSGPAGCAGWSQPGLRPNA